MKVAMDDTNERSKERAVIFNSLHAVEHEHLLVVEVLKLELLLSFEMFDDSGKLVPFAHFFEVDMKLLLTHDESFFIKFTMVFNHVPSRIDVVQFFYNNFDFLLIPKEEIFDFEVMHIVDIDEALEEVLVVLILTVKA